jgi:hypothetical protein
MRRHVVLDGRNVLDGRALASLGFTYLSIGRPPLRPAPTLIAVAGHEHSPHDAAIGVGDD